MNQLNSIERRADHIENDLNNYFTGFRSQVSTLHDILPILMTNVADCDEGG
jgi:hypothetical protein